ncbi:winged helix-turn-helix transcriptional regulator [Paenibacillus frigoriresistens]|nr:winged helix-turn-helix transcriptional regulator [Paenibacillus frigoriresistens]
MNKTFSALAEPNRLHIVELLRDGPLTVGEITHRLELQQPQVCGKRDSIVWTIICSKC